MGTQSTENYRNSGDSHRERMERDMILLLRRMVELVGPRANRIVADCILVVICVFVLLELRKTGDR